MANYSLTTKEKNSVSWNSSNELVIDGEVLGPSTGWKKEDTYYVNRKKPNSKIFQYSKDHADKKSWLDVDEISYLLADTYSEWGIRPSNWYRDGRPKERYDEKVKNFEQYGHPGGDLTKSDQWDECNDYGCPVQDSWNAYDNVRNPVLPTTDDPNWVQNFYSDNNIGGQGGDLSEDAKKYWTEQLRELGSQSEVERVIRDTSQNDGTWNMGHSNKVNIIKAGAEEGSTVYNSDNKKFDIRLYNISNKTDHKTDHDTNPNTVQKTESYDEKVCGGTWPFDWCDYVTKTREVTDHAKISQHKIMNAENEKLNEKNHKINEINRKRNKQLANLKNTVLPSTKGHDYVEQREKLRDFDLDQETKSAIEKEFRNYYKEEKIVEWDSSLAAPIPGVAGSKFDADYYRSLTKGKTNDVGEKWKEAEEDDDIDITERYGDSNTYALQDWSNTGRHAGLRAYEKENLVFSDTYKESLGGSIAAIPQGSFEDALEGKLFMTPEGWKDLAGANDWYKSDVKDRQLGIGEIGSQTERLFKIPYINNEFNKANNGDEYWLKLAREKRLNVKKKDDFVLLFRLSEREEDKDIQFINNVNNPYFTGITELEDAVNQAAGEDVETDVKKFGALTQSVLKDTIAEMKKAKQNEQFISTISGFGGFSEIMDMNRTLTNSILGDSGVGGYMSMMGGGKGEEKLEESIQNLSGIGNSVTYNWQKWFDERLVEKYSKGYKELFPLQRANQIIEKYQEFTKPGRAKEQEKIFNKSTGAFTKEFLNQVGFNTTEELEDFLNNPENFPAYNLEAENPDARGELDGKHLLAKLKDEIYLSESDRTSGLGTKKDNEWLEALKDNINTRFTDKSEELGVEDSINLATGTEDDPDTLEDESIISIESDFARDFINNYLTKRFDTSRSMDEFVEYLDIRDEEQNPFQTQDLLNAVKQTAELESKAYLSSFSNTDYAGFNASYYLDPTQVETEYVARATRNEEQRDRIAKDWDATKQTPDELIDEDLPALGTWTQQFYRYGINPKDPNLSEEERREQFAKMHYELIGRSNKFDGAEDMMSVDKVKDHIYTNILPNLSDEALKQGTVFGQFLKPEEWADDILQGLDPYDKKTWKEALQRFGLEHYEGDFDEFKDYVAEALRTSSAQEIREQIKYLNEKRQRPTQDKLGISYIEREEDYKDEQSKPDSELYKTFQDAGFQGTEDEFYNDFFPDVDRSEQQLLTKGGKDDPLKTFGLDMSDPFASLGTVSSFFEQDEDESDEVEKDEDSTGKSYFTFDTDDDGLDWDYKPKKKEQVFDEFTTIFKGL